MVVGDIMSVMLIPTTPCILKKKKQLLMIFCLCDDGDAGTNPLADVFCLFTDGLWIRNLHSQIFVTWLGIEISFDVF